MKTYTYYDIVYIWEINIDIQTQQYVLDCKSNGDKIVWKSLVRPDFSVNRIARLRKELVDSGLLSV